jgi:hypothetical protein
LPSGTDLIQHARPETRKPAQALYFATARADGRWMHCNYLAK